VDQIILKGMPFFGYHGVLAEETVMGQRFIVNVELSVDLSRPGVSDTVADTVNYAEVYQLVKQIVEGPPRKLIEAVAERIASEVLGHYTMVKSVMVEVEKPGAPIPGIFEQVSVKINRYQPML
jgi:7,8-dihydroneopterin aldolase/epimerase/oxygenase